MESFIADKLKKCCWFDLPSKTDLSRWKLSNQCVELSSCAYPSEKQGGQNEKWEDTVISENVSADMARTGIEPATQGFSVLKNPIWQLL
jgi:hypothetical protein